MNKRLEDRIIELAFEERAEAGVAELQTPEAAARLKEYRTMRSALGQLRELPEHQLSTERLRQALLHRGLSRRRTFPWQALGYAGVAAGLFVCAFFVSRDARRALSQPPRIETVASHGTSSQPQPAKTDLELPWFSSNSQGTAPVAIHAPRSHPHSYAKPEYAVAEPNPSPMTLATMSGPSATKPSAKLDGPIAHPKIKPTSTIPLSGAMVLIQPKTDADTGLDTATEVTASGDVLVGG